MVMLENRSNYFYAGGMPLPVRGVSAMAACFVSFLRNQDE
jgi:hypothetical protein